MNYTLLHPAEAVIISSAQDTAVPPTDIMKKECGTTGRSISPQRNATTRSAVSWKEYRLLYGMFQKNMCVYKRGDIL